MSSLSFGVEGKEQLTLQAQNQDIDTLYYQAIQYTLQGKLQQAIEIWQQVLKLAQQQGDKENEAIAYLGLGSNYRNTEKTQPALRAFKQALSIFQETKNRMGEMATLNNIGIIYNDIGQPQQALNYYNQALSILREVENRSLEATILNNIGQIYSDIGQPQQALSYYNQALPIRQEVGDRSKEATILNNIGRIYSDIGQPQQALNYYNQALPILQEVGDRSKEAAILNNIGTVYFKMGQPEEALKYYNQALPILREVGNRRQEAITLNNLGLFYNETGKHRKALQYYNQALLILREVGNRRQEATTLNNLGTVYKSNGQPEEALTYYTQALPISREVGDRKVEATTLNNLGTVYKSNGQPQQALTYYNQALPITREVGDRFGEATTLGNLASLEQSRNNLTQALNYIEQAINITEETRSEIISPDLKTSYFASVYDLYQLYIDILMELHQKDPNKGYDAQAFAASERSRARTLIELLTEANADIEQGIDPKLKKEEQSLRFQINAAEKQKIELFINNPNPDRIKAIQQKLDTLNAQYQDLKNRIRATSPRYAALQFPQPLTLAEVQNQVLDTDTTLLQFALGEERSYVWVVTKDTLKTYLLPPKAEIEEKVTAFSQWLGKNPKKRNFQQGETAGEELSEMLFSQISNELTQKRLVIVSDGALHNIPFAALPLPKTSATSLDNSQLLTENKNKLSQNKEINNPINQPSFLINHYEIVHLPSSSSLAIIREQNQQRKPAPKALAIFADAVYRSDDERLKNPPSQTTANNNLPNLNLIALNQAVENISRTRGGSPFLPRLDYSKTEAETLQTYLQAAETVSFFDFEANLKNAQETDLSPYQIIHFATHGILDTQRPELSGIVLSLYNKQGELINGYLRLNEIFNLNLSSELVVLSACETGLGKDMKGEGLIGLTRGFMYAGSPRVLVSLWKIDDEGTSEFMGRFYRLMLEENLTPVQALKATQLEMQQTETWSDPYYWAAFTLQGEWD